MRLARDYRDAGYADLLPGNGFAVEDPLSNALPVAAELLKTALGRRFRLREACPLPSYDLTAADHDASRYWRGPGWLNTSWLIWHGLRLQGETTLADDLRRRLLERVRIAGFREYLDPLTGAGHGTDDFSWTAALTLDLIRAA